MLDPLDFPEELEDPLVVLCEFWSQYAVERLYSIHGVLEVEGIPGSLGEIHLLGKQPVNDVRPIGVVKVDLLLVVDRNLAAASDHAQLLTLLYLPLLILHLNLHLSRLTHFDVNPEVLEAL